MNLENNLDLNNLNFILDIIKNAKKQEPKENSLLKINSTNKNIIKTILPLAIEDNENIYKILNCLEINQLINNYKEAYKIIDKEQILDLKKETMVHIKQNINENNKYMVDLFLKAMEIKSIINENYKRGDI